MCGCVYTVCALRMCACVKGQVCCSELVEYLRKCAYGRALRERDSSRVRRRVVSWLSSLSLILPQRNNNFANKTQTLLCDTRTVMWCGEERGVLWCGVEWGGVVWCVIGCLDEHSRDHGFKCGTASQLYYLTLWQWWFLCCCMPFSSFIVV